MNMNHPFLPKFLTWFLTVLLFISLSTFRGTALFSITGKPEQAFAQASQLVSTSTATMRGGQADSKELEALIDGIMAHEMKANRIPGAVVSVVKDGQLIFAKGYGYSDYENTIPVNPERTLFRVGSVCKLFVWTAVMQLVEQGKLDLDVDVNTYLDFKIPATYPQPITMKNLMAHTAGFEGSDQGLLQRPEERYTLEQYVKRYIPVRVFPPGKIEAYSNYGAALAGYIVERTTGLSFNDYIEKNLLTPLGMTHSTFRQPLPGNLASDLANGYYFARGQYVKAGFENIVPYPVGSLSSTGTDMARFMLAHLQHGQFGGRRILVEKTAQQMHSQLFTHDPRITGMAYGFYENMINRQRVLLHGGATLIFNSKLYLIPDQNTGIFISTNSPGGADTRDVLFQKFMDAYYPAETDSEQAPEPGFSIRAAPYLGAYYHQIATHLHLKS
jgi:CubicO group peptidase (beta-lactamase class C family)